MEDNRKGYYAIIPANVRYDKSLSMGARMLYGEITALCNQEGFCWANNAYFAELYDTSDKTIQRWITSLCEKGYIHRNIQYETNGKTVINRYLSIVANVPTWVQKCPEGTDKNVPTPRDKNVLYNNTITNNTINSIRKKESIEAEKPEVTKSEKAVKSYDSIIKSYTDNKELQTTLIEFIKMRKLLKKPMTDKALELMLNKLDKLASCDAEKINVLNQSICSSWQGIFPLKEIGSSDGYDGKSKQCIYDIIDQLE